MEVPPDEYGKTAGKLAFVDNTVDVATGTIKLRGMFDNTAKLLWPGQFVDTWLTLREEQSALVVPTQALQNGPKGQYVYVVKPDASAELREVDRGSNRGRRDRDWQAASSPAKQWSWTAPRACCPGSKVGAKSAGQAVVSIAEIFVRRPVMTGLVMIGILIFGIIQLPAAAGVGSAQRRFPHHRGHGASLPGASPETMAAAVATPLEKEFSTIAGLDSMDSNKRARA